MKFKKYYIVTNTREQFKNESLQSKCPYNDHPSNESVKYVTEQLCLSGYVTSFFGGVEELAAAYNTKQKFPDSLFLNFSDGLYQESRKAQTAILLELMAVSFAGSDALSRLIAGNKAFAKACLPDGILTPKSSLVYSSNDVPADIKFPVVIKPNREGSSLGITQKNLCTTKNQLFDRLEVLFQRYKEILIEEYIDGYEITCFLIGNHNHYYLNEPVMCEYAGVQYFDKFIFGLEEKANHQRKEYLASSFLDTVRISEIRDTSRIIFETLGMHDFARVDYRLKKDGKLFFLEINGNPVISKTSEIGTISMGLKKSFGSIVGDIIQAATDRFNHE